MTNLNKEAKLLAIRVRAMAMEGELLAMRMRDDCANLSEGHYRGAIYMELVRRLDRLADEAEQLSLE